MVLRQARIVFGGLCVAVVTLITTSWPDRWPAWPRLASAVVLAFLGVVMIELERREERAAARRPAVVPDARRPAAVPGTRRRPGAGHRWRIPGPADPAPAASAWPTPVRPELAEPLPGKESFRGRETELEDLLSRHREARAGTGAPAARGGRPVLLLMHGKPGVGKSALAQELARRLAEEYPHGQLYVNLGNAGDALSSGEILGSFLNALKWPGAIPERAEDRVRIFRTLTAGRRLLFILDAARDHRQVLDVLPNEALCAAIVTSRRDLGPNLGVTSRRLDVPDADDALEMLQTAARSQEHATLSTVEIIESCGRLPLAIQSAGERVSQERSDLVSVATLLRDKDSRLERLTRLGRNVEEGFATEYQQLDPVEQRALRLLGLVESGTFVPWVLCPLMQVPLEEAEDLADRLYRAQFIDYVAADPVTELVRYRLNPLVKLFAKARLEQEDPDGFRAGAVNRLDIAYESVICEVLAILEPDFTPPAHGTGADQVIAGPRLAALIAEHPDTWIRAEYANVAHSFRKAYSIGEWGVCWRIARRLHSLLPAGVPTADVMSLFDLALKAAECDGSVPGGIDVRIAKGSALIAVEHYREAFDLLETALRLTSTLGPGEFGSGEFGSGGFGSGGFGSGGEGHDPARLRQGLIYLKRGEAFLQMRRPKEAESQLQLAKAIFRAEHRGRELALVRLLVALNSDTDLDEPYEDLSRQLGEEYRFWVSLQRFEERRRRRDWKGALENLDAAERCCDGDARRHANVLYRRARLYLEHWRYHATAGDGRTGNGYVGRLPTKAIHRATEAMVALNRMSNVAGEARARCLLVRALTAAGQLPAANAQQHLVERELAHQDVAGSPAYLPLRARARWARGELRRAAGDSDDDRDLWEARRIFTEIEDGRSQRSIDRLLGIVGQDTWTDPHEEDERD
ncbi:MAG TPA: NB-ARC domain-containing protein [Rugosimonospora sp.]